MLLLLGLIAVGWVVLSLANATQQGIPSEGVSPEHDFDSGLSSGWDTFSGMLFPWQQGAATSTVSNPTNPLAALANAWVGQTYNPPNRSGPYCADFVSCVLQGSQPGHIPDSAQRVTTDFFGNTKPIQGPLQPGDLVYFDRTYDWNRDGVINSLDTYTHIGIYVGNNMFVHKGSGGTITKESLLDPYYAEHYSHGRR